ncbi:MAG: hypothetical protein IKX59_06400 [Bacteroidales bacterium]|nr:hypothetical protein [Bacteroidales bacterium]
MKQKTIRKNMRRTAFKYWDYDNFVVLKCVVDGYGDPRDIIYRKLSGGKEIPLSDIDPKFAMMAWYQGKEVSEDFYNNYK